MTGITLDKAREIAMESLDTATVSDEIARKVLGRYFEVTGVRIDKYLITESITPFSADVTAQTNALLASAGV